MKKFKPLFATQNRVLGNILGQQIHQDTHSKNMTVWWHATDKKNIPNILKQGIISKSKLSNNTSQNDKYDKPLTSVSMAKYRQDVTEYGDAFVKADIQKYYVVDDYFGYGAGPNRDMALVSNKVHPKNIVDITNKYGKSILTPEQRQQLEQNQRR